MIVNDKFKKIISFMYIEDLASYITFRVLSINLFEYNI